MDSLKSIIFTIFVVVLLGFSGYWAFTTLESGSSHVDVQKLKELENQNKELTKEVTDLNRQISLLEADKAQANTNPVQDTSDTSQNPNTAVVTTQTITTNPAPVKTTTNTKPIVNKNQSLIDDLQKLANSKIFLKLKSQGPEVGTIQKFLNIYQCLQFLNLFGFQNLHRFHKNIRQMKLKSLFSYRHNRKFHGL